MNELATISQNKQVAEAPLSPAELTEQVKLIQTVMKNVMIPDTHYGKIPGCGPKPALFKAGAEKLQLTFRLHPDFEIQETDLPQGHKNFRVVCRLTNQSGGFQGAGVGYGSTRETKYLTKGGRETNPADYYNVVLKMSKKRAQVDAILTSTAASDIFTQDLEDMNEKDLPRRGLERQGEERRGMASRGGAGRAPEPEDVPLARDNFVENLSEKSSFWRGKIKVTTHEGQGAKGPWKLFRVTMEDDDEKTCTTFDEALAADAEIIANAGTEVKVLYEPNKRKAGTLSYLGFEALEQPAEELPWQ